MTDTNNKLEDLEVLNGDDITGAGCGPEAVDRVTNRARGAVASTEGGSAEAPRIERPGAVGKVVDAIEPDRP